ncbi:transglycosylase domain-containing protein, partial [Myxococcota bacterium]|nr:transglycosylase domain-containing protein [Myxococcota bacterium]
APPPPAVRAAAPARTAPVVAPAGAARPSKPPPPPPRPPRKKAAPRPPGKPRSLLFRLVRAALALGLLGAVAGGALAVGAWRYYGADLPTVDALSTYQPPTVTVVYDRDGELLGEIYEKRRYVVPLEQIPKHVQDAFIGAEDANFWVHEGVDYGGILRAIGRNAIRGRKAQGASTITQQVARNFLLSTEKTYERKIREIILAGRIEEVFDKEHILYLYLNQIYLGSGAYGVEAASRVYFDKHVSEITLAEAAILAGLPQRPSDYSPHQHWDKARTRQEYVLDQMLQKDLIDRATHDATLAEVVRIAPRTNEFLTQAPYFTEHVRRYLVDTYGFDKIYNDGLTVYATCDLDLQKAAQESVRDNVLRASNSIGWRGAAETLAAGEIAARRDATEQALRKAESEQVLHVGPPDHPQAGPGPVPDRSTLATGERYQGVVLSVEPRFAVVGVGAHEVLVPITWSKWMYPPDPERSFKSRVQTDLTKALAPGDVVTVTVEAPTVAEVADLSDFADVGRGRLAGRIYQDPDIEGALLSYRLSDGAVIAMVGGYDFQESEFNRATQAMRQVGSTFKPLVYAAAIGTRKVTTGTVVQDAPTVFGVLGFGLYKPDNYGEDYLGNITLRKALQLSRNVVTVRILDKVGLEPVFQLAGPRLRIGYDTPRCSRTHVPADAECPGTLTASPVAGMAWCEHCEPESCSMIRVDDPARCVGEVQSRDGETWCRSCDVSLRVCSWAPKTQLSLNEECLDARLDSESGEVMCRACDLSMGLGSSSLTMTELTRAYSAFATYGRLVEPHWIDRVVDRDGTVIEAWQAPDAWPQVLEPGVAGIAHWLLREVATGGTGAATNKLGIHVAGKTGTTNDFKDTWFVGYNTELVTTAWVGYDQPRSLGVSFTGGGTALPIWMDYMQVAAPKDADKPFPPIPGVEMVPIDESTGRVARGGREMPMLPGTAPTNVIGEIGQKTAEDLLTSDF